MVHIQNPKPMFDQYQILYLLETVHPNSNLTFLTESKKQGNVEYKQFYNNEGN